MIEGVECQCGKKVASKRITCPECKGPMKETEFGDSGTIITHTTLHVPSEGFIGPITLCMVELSVGARLLCQYKGEKDPEIGDQVRTNLENGIYFCTPDL